MNAILKSDPVNGFATEAYKQYRPVLQARSYISQLQNNQRSITAVPQSSGKKEGKLGRQVREGRMRCEEGRNGLAAAEVASRDSEDFIAGQVF